jgi:hypothetical protein
MSGLRWSGKPSHVNDRKPLDDSSRPLRAICRAGLPLRDVQPHLRDVDRRDAGRVAAGAGPGAELLISPTTAALAEALDLVISVDTGVAPTWPARSGPPLWILLPHAPDWR